MLSLPSKQWKKVRLLPVEGDNRYRVVFLSPISGKEAFARIVDDELPGCLSGAEAVTGSDWKTKSVDVVVDDVEFFRQRLVFRNIIIEED